MGLCLSDPCMAFSIPMPLATIPETSPTFSGRNTANKKKRLSTMKRESGRVTERKRERVTEKDKETERERDRAQKEREMDRGKRGRRRRDRNRRERTVCTRVGAFVSKRTQITAHTQKKKQRSGKQDTHKEDSEPEILCGELIVQCSPSLLRCGASGYQRESLGHTGGSGHQGISLCLCLEGDLLGSSLSLQHNVSRLSVVE